MEHRKVQITKKLFKQALIELLMEENISKVTIKQLCEKAELNRSTFYAHYEDIYFLLDDLENDMINTMPFIDPSLKQNHQDIINLAKYFERNYDAIIVLIHNGKLIQRTVDKSVQYFLKTEGSKSAKEMEYFLFCTHFYIGGLFQSLVSWYDNHEYISIHELSQIIYKLLNSIISIRKDFM